MKKFTVLRKSLIALTLAVLAVPQMASAATPLDRPIPTAVSVQFTDLNLSNPAGLNALYSRISNAARAVCGHQSDLKLVGSLKQLRINKACYDTTLAQALAEVNFPATAQASRQ